MNSEPKTSNCSYISTAIPYINAKPHIGHALEYVQTDAIARYKKLLGRDVFFLSGSDENSLKNVRSAELAGVSVQEFVDEHYKYFKNFDQALNTDFSDFIRTSADRHHEGAKKFWSLFKLEDLEKRKYKGLYCVGCEAFYKEDDLVDGKCPDHKVEPEEIEEENWFFKLSNYQEKIKELIEKDVVKITPEFRKNEWLAFIDRGLEDFSISRSKERAHGWGVEVPGDSEQIMYVWVDALSNYITALDFANDSEKYKKYWQNCDDKLHVIGKGIAKFHVLYWPAMLLSAGIELPEEIFIHGYMTIEGEKISKSLGNTVDPYEVVEKYGTDPVRYYLLGALSSTKDGDWSEDRFQEFYTAHLVNGIGNLTSRILTMLEKYSESKIPQPVESKKYKVKSFWKSYDDFYNKYIFDKVVLTISNFVEILDKQISDEKPWEKAKNGEDISELLYQLAEGLRHIAVALLPIIPDSAEKILEQLGTTDTSRDWGKLQKNVIIKKGEILFPRLLTK